MVFTATNTNDDALGCCDRHLVFRLYVNVFQERAYMQDTARWTNNPVDHHL
jgi:hypothetical protein